MVEHVRAGTDVRRWRLIAVALPVTASVAIAAVVGHPMGDWNIARLAGDFLLGGHFDVYAAMPKAQMGPLALLLAGALPGWAYLAVACILLPLLLLLVMMSSPPSVHLHGVVLIGGLLLAWPWTALGVQGHLDDALVTLCAVSMAVAYEQNRRGWLAAALVLALAAKPTAIVFLPLVLMRSRRAGVAALIIATAIWAPFFLADPIGFLAAGRGPGDVWPGSLHWLLGAEPYSGFPMWVRPAQLVGCLLLCWRLTHHRGPAAALLGVLGLRTLLEPGAWNYYGSALAAVGLLFDMRHLRWPLATSLGVLSFATVLSTPISTTGGYVRLFAITATLALAAGVFGRSSANTDVLMSARRASASDPQPDLPAHNAADGREWPEDEGMAAHGEQETVVDPHITGTHIESLEDGARGDHRELQGNDHGGDSETAHPDRVNRQGEEWRNAHEQL